MRNGVQHAEDPAGYGLVVLGLGKRPAHFNGVLNRETTVGKPHAGTFLLQNGALAIGFVHDLAHDLLDDVLDGN